MCGIAGILHADPGQEASRQLIKRMTDAIAHRGPDGEGFHVEPGLALGHRRLAVLDPEGGHQPMFSADGGVAVVYNGEIFNFTTLRAELAEAGHVFRTAGDTETILHAWERYGPDCVTHLSGQFAFAIWDRARQTLFCARDRMGEKPFHYAWLDHGGGRDFVFASELAALAVVPGMSRRISASATEDFFTFGYVPEPATIFEGISKLPAAHTLLIERGAPPVLRRYWSPPSQVVSWNDADAVTALRGHLDRAIGAQLVADVPLGAFLSGGVDSSAVVAIAAGLRSTPLDTFTIGFAGAEDETPYARRVAARYATRQHEDRAEAVDMIDAARHQAIIFGEPFGDASSVPTATVCRLARRHTTVAVSGDGGDEIFAGYRRTRWHMLVSAARRYVPGPAGRRIVARLAAIYPKLDRAPRFLRAKHTLTELSLDDADGFARISTKLHAGRRHALFSPSLRAHLDGHDPTANLVRLMTEAEDADPLLQAQLADLATWLPGDILTKSDRASMAASLEVRAPFLDHQLAGFGLSLPSSLKLRHGEGKYVLKQAMEKLLPHDILYRPKQGFANDLAPYFRNNADRLRDRLLGPVLLSHGLFDAAAIGRLIDEHCAGAFDHAQPIWLLLAFEGFLHMLAQTAPAPAPVEHAV